MIGINLQFAAVESYNKKKSALQAQYADRFQKGQSVKVSEYPWIGETGEFSQVYYNDFGVPVAEVKIRGRWHDVFVQNIGA